MKFFPQRLWLVTSCGLFILATWLMVTATAFAQDKKPGALAPGSFVLSFAEGRVSLEANEASLATIFKELGWKAAIVVDLQHASDEKLSIKLDRVPLDEAIKRSSTTKTREYKTTGS